ncbi:cysteine hydrolase family protein [Nocardioides sp.]|jgi:nicotinamidase-related amidase|uniref:cysteine hydrolase family protein n=1 Tax=Nocardioides sp. TaxID=35761 RepID=UPI002CB0A9D0|nr:isochorismatase family protein [Nocardioides sp.]HVX55156.1 isochorismatase family protein [Nocardioides sp.]
MWTRPEPHVIDPTRTALIVFDMLECYRSEIEASGALPYAQELVQVARDNGILICFARADHREDGADFTRVVADVDRRFEPWTDEHPQPTRPSAGSDYRSLAELGQGPADIDIRKHRWSAFHGTALDLTLRVQGIDTVLICGGSTHVGVASTVYAGRDLDYQMIVVKDACTGHREQRDYFCDTIFPRMVRVRTVKEIGTMIQTPERTTA